MINLEYLGFSEDGNDGVADNLDKIIFYYASEIIDSALSEQLRCWLTAFTFQGYKLYLDAKYSEISQVNRQKFEYSEVIRKKACAQEAHYAALHFFGDFANGTAIHSPIKATIPKRSPDRITRDGGAFCWILIPE